MNESIASGSQTHLSKKCNRWLAHSLGISKVYDDFRKWFAISLKNHKTMDWKLRQSLILLLSAKLKKKYKLRQ